MALPSQRGLLSQLQDSLAGITSALSEPSSDLEALHLQIKEFERLFSEKAIHLPPYDVKKLQSSVLDLKSRYAKARDESVPKKRFAFKSRLNIKTREELDKASSEARQPTPFSAVVTGNLEYKDKKGETIEVDSKAEDPVVSNLEDCFVRSTGGVPSTVHITDLKNCRVLLGPVVSSVFVDRCHGCKFAFFCQQLRMHNSQDCDVYLRITSKGIIEDCKNIGFAPYNANFEGLKVLVDKSGLDSSSDNWDDIQDFNWLSPNSPSPNWYIIPENGRKNYWN